MCIRDRSYDDIFFSNHRGHGQSIAQDMDLNKMMAELAGKAKMCIRDRSLYFGVAMLVRRRH